MGVRKNMGRYYTGFQLVSGPYLFEYIPQADVSDYGYSNYKGNEGWVSMGNFAMRLLK